MSFLAIFLRRLLLVLLITAAGGVAWSWRRDQAADDAHGPPEWPPLNPDAAPTATASSDGTSQSSGASQPDGTAHEAEPDRIAADGPAQEAAAPAEPSPASSSSTANSAASFINALVDAPEARSQNGELGGWTEPLEDGSCPLSHPIKANDNSGIFHVPEGRFYARTKPERCYSDAAAATADGYRQAKH